MFKLNYDIRDYNDSFANGLRESIGATMILNIGLSFFLAMLVFKTSLSDFFSTFIGLVFYTSLVVGLLTALYSTIIVYPIVVLLRLFKIDTDINIALFSGFGMFTFVMLAASGGFRSPLYVVILYAMVCGYAFMQGYKK